ncbi:unnamed protein product [Pseudo-nitzschia multistriata]|uniref:Uncharacterized protein n=1 Tax=Pseudo-nitzschia multistriata TaxID=183589 RepID=A0A448Z6F6_9STRA|nr:unnamed protein product [Pseudo-nitzschia multistriata]
MGFAGPAVARRPSLLFALGSTRGSVRGRGRFPPPMGPRKPKRKPKQKRPLASRAGSRGDPSPGARPLFLQRTPRWGGEASLLRSLPPTPYDLRGTALLPGARHLSPCLGAALSVSPLLGNLLLLGQLRPEAAPVRWGPACSGENENEDEKDDARWSLLLSQVGFLANNLFFRLIRESPVHLVRNRSMPASHLDPGLIGCFLANHHREGSSPEQARAALGEGFGIRSNRIRGTEWTGISLARWTDLLAGFPEKRKGGSTLPDKAFVCHAALVSALWGIALWAAAPSRDSWAGEYAVALARAGISVPASFGGLPPLGETDLSRSRLDAAMDRLLDHCGEPWRALVRDDDDDEEEESQENDTIARSFELVCAAIVLQSQPLGAGATPPVVPNGYYTFDGGDSRADCTEAAVREILTLLLWDEEGGKMDPSRLPASASPELLGWLTRCDDDEVRETELGRAWFELLSDLPGCEYLSASPGGRPFELAPTSESISGALWHLLVGTRSDRMGEDGNRNRKGNGNGNGNGSSDDTDDTNRNCNSDPKTPQEPWTSLYDLAEFWSGLEKEGGSSGRREGLLVAYQDRLRHRAPTGGAVMEHESLTLHLRDSPRAVELRLRCDRGKASGMAAVTHLALPRAEPLLDPDRVRRFLDLCEKEPEHGTEPVRARLEPSWRMLGLALRSVEATGTEAEGSPVAAPDECLAWLATPYGPDRRELVAGGSGTDHGEASKQNRLLLRKRILRACELCATHPGPGAHLLSWILREPAAVVETSSSPPRSEDEGSGEEAVERALLGLPPSVLEGDDGSLLEAIEGNPVCLPRGGTLARVIRWRLGRISMPRMLWESGLHELADVASFYRCTERPR